MNLPDVATDAWLAKLNPCTPAQYRRELARGGQPVFVLSANSKIEAPEWCLLLLNGRGVIFRVVAGKDPVCRRIDSLKVVYRTARLAGLAELNLPIDLKGSS